MIPIEINISSSAPSGSSVGDALLSPIGVDTSKQSKATASAKALNDLKFSLATTTPTRQPISLDLACSLMDSVLPVSETDKKDPDSWHNLLQKDLGSSSSTKQAGSTALIIDNVLNEVMGDEDADKIWKK